MKMVEGGTVVEHLNEFNIVTSELTLVGINFDDEFRALLIVSSLSESWDSFAMLLSNSTGLSTLKFDDVVSVTFSEAVCRKSSSESLGSALWKKKGQLKEGKIVRDLN